MSLPNLRTLKDLKDLFDCVDCYAEYRDLLVLRREHAQKELDKIPAPEPSDFNKDMIRFVQKSSYWRGRLDELNEQLGIAEPVGSSASRSAELQGEKTK